MRASSLDCGQCLEVISFGRRDEVDPWGPVYTDTSPIHESSGIVAYVSDPQSSYVQISQH